MTWIICLVGLLHGFSLKKGTISERLVNDVIAFLESHI